MDTDYGVPMEVDRIRARVSKVMETQAGSEEVQTWVSVFSVSDDVAAGPGAHTLPATFGILPDDSDLNREIVIELEALANGSDHVLVSRRLKTGFVTGEARLVRMQLYRACEGVSCSAGETCGCSGGLSCTVPSCIDEMVRPEDLESIDNPGVLPPDAGIPILDGGVPDGGGIICGAPLTVCGLDCVNTQADPRYCGDCNTACAIGYVCDAGNCTDAGDCREDAASCSGFTYCEESTGECLPGCTESGQCTGDNQACDPGIHDCICAPGFELCEAGCVDTQGDPNFCGDCSTSCASGDVCQVGICLDPGDCRTIGVDCSGFTYCDDATGDCLRGCGDDDQCTDANQVCDTVTHGCVCDDTFEQCGQMCCPTSCPPGQALYNGVCAEWHLQTVDAEGNNGQHTSIALDAADAAHISYYASSGRDLRYAAQQADGSWIPHMPDAEGNAGQYTSAAFDPAGVLHVAYYNASDKDLMLATRQGDGSWAVVAVDDSDDDVGQVHVASLRCIRRPPHQLLRRGQQRSHVCHTVDRWDLGMEIWKPSIAPATWVSTPRWLWVRSVRFTSVTTIRATEISSTRCGSSLGLGQLKPSPATGHVGKYTSVALDGTGAPHISYYGEDNMTRDLLYATMLAGGSWMTETVESLGRRGQVHVLGHRWGRGRAPHLLR